jgi:N-acyl-D-aspartate/D-glutamate deacylase
MAAHFDLVIRGSTVADGTGGGPGEAIVGGEITYCDGAATGALPGRLLRGARRSNGPSS